MEDDEETEAEQARAILQEEANIELIAELRKHKRQLGTIILLILVVMAVQALACMTLAKRLTVVVMPGAIEIEARGNAAAKFPAASDSAGLVRPGKTPAGDSARRERGAL